MPPPSARSPAKKAPPKAASLKAAASPKPKGKASPKPKGKASPKPKAASPKAKGASPKPKPKASPKPKAASPKPKAASPKPKGKASPKAYRFKPTKALSPEDRAPGYESTPEGKYCSCVISVAAKGQTRPYGICAASTKGSNRRCGKNYDFEHFTDEDLAGYALLNGIEPRQSRKALLAAISRMKAEKYGAE